MGLPNDCDKAGGRDPVPLRRKGAERDGGRFDDAVACTFFTCADRLPTGEGSFIMLEETSTFLDGMEEMGVEMDAIGARTD